MQNDIEVTTVYGLMTFGAQATEWEEELFYYRTGIAMRLEKERQK